MPAFQAVIYSTDALDSVNKLETSTDVYKLVLDDEQGHVSSDAGELLELGRQLVKDGGETASGPQAQPSDVALTMVSEGIALQFTHLVSGRIDAELACSANSGLLTRRT